MRRTFLLLLGLLVLVPFALSQESEIEIAEPPAEGADDEEETRKKNVGLAGGGQENGDDANAPKVKIPLQKQINDAIKRGVKWLKSAQNKDGSWDPVTASRDYATGKDIGTRYRDEMGPTIWSIYTLAKCGVKRRDPVIRRGLKYVFKETEYLWDDGLASGETKFGGRTELQNPSRMNPRTMSTYEVAALIMMIEAVYEGSAKLTGKHSKRELSTDNPLDPPSRSRIPKDTWRFLHRRVRYLTTGFVKKSGGGRGRSSTMTIKGLQRKQGGQNNGGWRYHPGGNAADLSATQFALLGLRAASQAGYPVERTAPTAWKDAAEYVKRCQKGNGGFGYQFSSSSVTGGMTACGVGCLLICREQMALAGQPKLPWIDDAIDRGMGWLDKNFDATRNPGGSNHHYYYLYGIERVGDLTGRKEFNGKDWYVRGARLLIEQQSDIGWWKDRTEAFPPQDVNSTTLALLFLKRATPPTVTSTGN